MLWLKDNLVTIAVCLVLAAIVVLIIRSMIRDRRAGRSPCGGNCTSCGVCGGCHAEQKQK